MQREDIVLVSLVGATRRNKMPLCGVDLFRTWACAHTPLRENIEDKAVEAIKEPRVLQ